MTRASSSNWAVVYLGIGSGVRFRSLRDEFFPGLLVIAFDPFEDGPYYEADTEAAVRNAALWNGDGTDFTFHVRCFDLDQDVPLIQEQTRNRSLLFISDIRGVVLLENGHFDKMHDLNLQWEAIKRLHPVSSLVKFDAPSLQSQFFDYAPGTLLKQVFCNYCTHEVRLLIDGVPEYTRRYNAWELSKEMKFHHEHMRGLVYDMPRRPYTACLDSCFDCCVLWSTVSSYAAQNNVCPDAILSSIINSHLYIPGDYPGYTWEGYKWVPPTLSQRWSDVQWYLQHGLLSEAIAGLEAKGEDEGEDIDWTRIAKSLSAIQPCLAQRLRLAPMVPASRGYLINMLCTLSTPLTIVRNSMNGLLRDEVKA